ncbi:MAG TPA: TonB-dependent receptor [Candidatus Limnocylindrales bacterium]|nr:TonB-dependent receptor [Candidatus Limnocylindrales bacterium]
MKNVQRMVFFLLATILFAGSAIAQTAATAELRGTVKDPNGAVIQGAAVSLHDEAKNIDRSAQTNAAGEYVLLSVPPGRYTLTVTAKGFSKMVAKNVSLTVGQAAEYPVTMQLATAETEITVTGEPLLVETSKTSTSTTIGQQRIENLPINGRNYVNFSLINSQVQRDVAPSIGAAPTSGLNFGGQRARSNAVNVDGMDAVDNSVNGIRSTVSQEGVQEFQIITNGYEAEYGRASGGVVNIITKSGTNDFHGSAFGFLRNRKIQAVNPFSNTPDPAYTRVQAGVAFGGPLKKDRTFYYFSFETTRRQETGFSTIGANNFGLVPLANAGSFGLPAGSLVTPDQAQFLATVPVSPLSVAYAQLAAGGSGVALAGVPGAPGPLGAFPTSGAPLPASFHNLLSQIGNYPVSEATDVYSLRLDHKFSGSNQLMLRGGLSPSDVTGIQVNAQNQDFGQNAFSRTSTQSYHDGSIGVQDTWILGENKINDLRYQYSRRGLLYNFSRGVGGGDVAVNIPGFAFFGREPFSFVRRVEQRHQIADNFSWIKGRHNIKFGTDINHLPVTADFTVNFGGIYNFGELTATSISQNFAGAPNFSAVQAYGLGIPQVFIQGIGNPHDQFNLTTMGFFLQDSWRMNSRLTLNYGVRYDYELTPVFNAVNALSQAAQDALGITQGVPRDSNNIAPRIGLAFDPKGDGKTVIRASYGLFYDHPLLALAFDSDVADGSQAPQFILFGGAPCNPAAPPSPAEALNLNATNAFQGLLGVGNCLPPGLASAFNFVDSQQRFDPTPNAASILNNQAYLTAGPGGSAVPLISQPFGFPTGQNFQYGYAEQGSFAIEHDLGHDFAISAAYNYTGGHHLNRPINANPTNPRALIENWERANSWAIANGQPTFSNPLTIDTCNVGPAGAFVPPALMSFFRKSGINPSLTGVFAPCLGLANLVAQQYNLGVGVPVPFSDMVANFSNGSSVYHALTVNLRKRMKNHFEFLGSYTWSHAIDDSTDLQTLLSPQNDLRPDLERANSTFDQRHRFVFSGMYQSGKAGSGFWGNFFSNWTLAPIIEFSSGRPFNIVTATDQNFNFSTSTDRPNAVAAGTPTNACGFPTVASTASPTGAFQIPCFVDANPLDGVFTGSLDGNLGRNAGTRPMTIFTDMRVARTINFNERFKLEGSMDAFNFINRFNVADVNSLYTEAGQSTAAFDPRQLQFGLKLSW